jgi:hypothetical protein
MPIEGKRGEVYLEKVKANLKGVEAVAERLEVPKREVVVEPLGALKDRCLVVKGQGLQKKRYQGDDGSRWKLAAPIDG